MSTATLTNTCPACGAEESLDALLLRMIDDDQVRRLIADVLTLSLPLGGLVVRYLRLHKPAKQKLRMDKLARLLGELVPDIQRNAIERNGRTWAIGTDGWKAALQAVFDAHDKGTLSVPLEGNGYLYQVLMRLADKAEAFDERATEAGRRHSATGPVSVKGQAVSIGAAIEQALPGRDPALVKLDQDKQRTTGMPEHVRQQIAALRGGRAGAATDPSTEKGTQA
jgi:hypothetical protein